MKKMGIFLTAVLIFALSISGIAEVADLTNMSLEELINLRDDIGLEIDHRMGYDTGNPGFSDDKIGEGKYIVGKDIIEGRYDLICTISDMDDDGDARFYVSVRESTDEGANLVDEFMFIPEGTMITFDLKEGNVLELRNGSGIIRQSSHSWAP